jgi:hypothetical protein
LNRAAQAVSDLRVSDLAARVDALDPADTIADAISRLRRQDSPFLPVVAEDAPVGLIWREQVLAFLSADRGRGEGLSARVTRVMDTAPLLVAADATLGEAMAALACPTAQGRGAALVIWDGAYAGMIDAATLLRAMASARPQAQAIDHPETTPEPAPCAPQNPASRLPGPAVMAHELRTPLSGMIGLVDLLSQCRLDTQARALVTTLSDQGRAMNALLSNLVDLSRLESGTLSACPEEVDLPAFLRSVADSWRPAAMASRLTLSSSFVAAGPDRVRVDSVRLRQIVDNLIGNAVKFAGSKGAAGAGEIALVLESLRLDGGVRLRLEVLDTGPGLPSHTQSALFAEASPAQQASDAGARGSGLGLAIVQGLTHALGGTLSYRPNTPSGSRFLIELPAEAVSAQKPQPAALAPENRSRSASPPRATAFRLGRVLLVEDHPVNQMVLAQTLRAAGWQVDAVGTCEQALRRGLEIAYQAVLCDLYLPDGQGFEIARQLGAASSASAGAVLMALTADTDPEIRRACAAAGFVRVAHKPVDPAILVSGLADAILQAEALSELRAAG